MLKALLARFHRNDELTMGALFDGDRLVGIQLAVVRPDQEPISIIRVDIPQELVRLK